MDFHKFLVKIIHFLQKTAVFTNLYITLSPVETKGSYTLINRV